MDLGYNLGLGLRFFFLSFPKTLEWNTSVLNVISCFLLQSLDGNMAALFCFVIATLSPLATMTTRIHLSPLLPFCLFYSVPLCSALANHLAIPTLKPLSFLPLLPTTTPLCSVLILLSWSFASSNQISYITAQAGGYFFLNSWFNSHLLHFVSFSFSDGRW